MSTTILTDEQKAQFVTDIANYGTGFVAPLFAVVESIEQAVLQSPEVQAWKKDAERWSFARDILTIDDIETAVENMRGFTPDPDESAKADAAIDAAMEKQP